YVPADDGHPMVLLGNGDGTFGTSLVSSASFGSYRGVAVGDLTGDGKLDLVATYPVPGGSGGGIEILLGNGDGTFRQGWASPQLFPYARWITTGDFTGDGKLDLAISDGMAYSDQTGEAEL